jgi:hypothetical protein
VDDRDVEVEALLAAERGPPTQPGSEVEARVWAKLRASVSALPVEPPLPAARPPLGWLGAGVVAGLVAGAAAGWVLHERSSPAPQVVFITLPAQVAPVVVNPAPSELTEPVAPARKEARVTVPRAQTLDPQVPDPQDRQAMDRERVWLERARTALQRSLGEEAWQALESHRREFPAGELVEEREALTVQAQLLRGRADEARAAAARFRARFPESVLLPGVEAAVGP